jgi:CBS domain-containing protein
VISRGTSFESAGVESEDEETMQIKELMTTNGLVSVRPEDTLELASQMMLWAEVAHLPVVARGRVVGLLAEHDLVGRTDLSKPVREAMSVPPLTVAPTDDVIVAAALMASRNIGCLPVVEDGIFTGIVTTGDLLRQLARQLAKPVGGGSAAHVDGVMTRDPATAHPGDTMVDAVARMRGLGVRHLPVVDGDHRLVGIISDRDVRSAVAEAHEASDDDDVPNTRIAALRVRDVMTRDPFTLLPNATIGQAARLLIEHQIGAAPVVDSNGRLVGILSYVDVMRATTRDAA